MSGNFNFTSGDPHADFADEYGGGDEVEIEVPDSESEQTAAKIVNSLTRPTEDEETSSDDTYLDDVDFRLEVAQTYRELLRAPLYNTPTKATLIVEREIRAFVRERLELLLSLRVSKTPVLPVEQPFTETEVKAIKLLIAELMKRPELLKASNRQVTTQKVPPAPTPRAAPPPKEAPAPRSPVPPAPRMNQATPPVTAVKTESPAAPPKAKPKKPSKAPPVTEKRTVVGNDGLEHEIEVPRIQRPEGMVPFPTDMTVATAASSYAGVGAAAKKKDLQVIAGAVK